MKNENISKINKLGKAGKIISVFFIIASIAAFVASALVSIVGFTLDDDFITANFHGTGNIAAHITSPLVSGFDASELEFNKSIKIFGLTFKSESDIISAEKNDNSSTDVNVDIEMPSGRDLRIAIALFSAAAAVISLCFTVLLMFAKKLFASLEKCSSPFEEDVLLRMKRFAYSLIPFGIIKFAVSGLLNLELFAAIVIILLFVAIFSYGAQLQKESDETL